MFLHTIFYFFINFAPPSLGSQSKFPPLEKNETTSLLCSLYILNLIVILVHPYHCSAGLFLGIWNWGGIDKCLGCVNMHEALIYIKKHTKSKKKYSLSGGGGVSSLHGGGCHLSTGETIQWILPPKIEGCKNIISLSTGTSIKHSFYGCVSHN